MSCEERYRDALADAAAGAPLPAELEAHVAGCDACRAELATLRSALVLVDAELATIAGAEPLPSLRARIHEAAARPSRASWRFGWLWPAVAAAALLLVAIAVGLTRPSPTSSRAASSESGREAPRAASSESGRKGPPVSEPSSRAASVASGREGSAVSEPSSSLRSALAQASRAPRARVAVAEPAVLVPPGGQEALVQFVALVHAQRSAPAAFAAAGEPSADLPEPAPVDIEPLEIVPLDPAESIGTTSE